jgi:hypothetical protein
LKTPNFYSSPAQILSWTSPLLLLTLTTIDTHASPDSSSSSSSSIDQFTPQMDWAALVPFVSIMLTSLWLAIRTNQVERAIMEREEALRQVRKWKSRQLEASPSAPVVSAEPSGDAGCKGATTTTTTTTTVTIELEKALKSYEEAVQKEETLRNVVPGGRIRIVPPSGAGQAAERTAREVAKQILGKEYDIGVATNDDDPPQSTKLETKSSSGRRSGGTTSTSNGQLPPLAASVLVVLGISLTALLVVLSMDPSVVSIFFEGW